MAASNDDALMAMESIKELEEEQKRISEEQKRISEDVEKQEGLTDEAVQRLEEKQERVSEEINKLKQCLMKEDVGWTRSASPAIGTFQKVGLEFVDQDKLERMRLAKELQKRMREAAQADILAWRNEFRGKVSGKNPTIFPAGGELIMTSK